MGEMADDLINDLIDIELNIDDEIAKDEAKAIKNLREAEKLIENHGSWIIEYLPKKYRGVNNAST